MNILADEKFNDIIKWCGNSGQFVLLQPNEVARIWGVRKGIENMDYTTLSRALRYYYGKNLLTKIKTQSYGYKFVGNLKTLIGYSLQEIMAMKHGLPNLPNHPKHAASPSEKPEKSKTNRKINLIQTQLNDLIAQVNTLTRRVNAMSENN